MRVRNRPKSFSDDASRVAVIIINYRTPDLTIKCLQALEQERRSLPRMRVVVVDGGSGDQSRAALSRFCDGPEYRDWVNFLPLPTNGGFGWANNQAILLLARCADPPAFIHLLNPDAEVLPDAVVRLVEYMREHPRVAAVGSQLINGDGSRAGSAFSFPTVRGEFSRGARTGIVAKLLCVPPIAIEAEQPMRVDWVTGGSVLLRLDALREVGLFDDGFFLYNEEVELMWRLRRAGWEIATEPRSRVVHFGGAATGVSNAPAGTRLERRLPAYVFRSRARFFALTRGPLIAIAAYGAWLAGNVIWWVRRLAGLSKGAPVDHQFRDHLRAGFPRWHDSTHAVATLADQPGRAPAWMERRWR